MASTAASSFSSSRIPRSGTDAALAAAAAAATEEEEEEEDEASVAGQVGSSPVFAQLVIGPPGAGKTTYCLGMQQFMAGLGR